MKILFLTTLNIGIDQEHYFTKNVWKELSQLPKSNLASIQLSNDTAKPELIIEKKDERNYYILKLPSKQFCKLPKLAY